MFSNRIFDIINSGSNIVFFGIKVVLLVIEYGMIMYMFGMNEIEKQYIKNMIKR